MDQDWKTRMKFFDSPQTDDYLGRLIMDSDGKEALLGSCMEQVLPALLKPIAEIKEYAAVAAKLGIKNGLTDDSVDYTAAYSKPWVSDIHAEFRLPDYSMRAMTATPRQLWNICRDDDAVVEELVTLQEEIRKKIIREEDLNFIEHVKSAGVATTAINFDEDLVDAINGYDYCVLPRTLVNRLITNEALREIIDPVNQRELLMAGYLGRIANTMLITVEGTATYEFLDSDCLLLAREDPNVGHLGIQQQGSLQWSFSGLPPRREVAVKEFVQYFILDPVENMEFLGVEDER